VVGDVAVLLVITLMIFYFAVIYEPTAPNEQGAVVAQVRAKATEVALAAGDRMKLGTHTSADVRTLQHFLGREGDALEPLIAGETNEPWYTVSEVWGMLGTQVNDRWIRRRISTASEHGDAGVRRRTDGRGWEVAASAMFALFGDEFKSGRRAPSDTERQSVARAGGAIRLVAPPVSQETDTLRRKAGEQ
jgi:hypothetical protein